MNILWGLFYGACSMVCSIIGLLLAARFLVNGNLDFEGAGLVFALMGAASALGAMADERLGT